MRFYAIKSTLKYAYRRIVQVRDSDGKLYSKKNVMLQSNNKSNWL